ncbi:MULTISPECIES: DMT family transporter [unclassified Sinorhizobium]|uniref:DMT family transporter n=1 Tax=unclassified Sinorhizobium TaxID=2613772 RepID=UPI0035267A98
MMGSVQPREEKLAAGLIIMVIAQMFFTGTDTSAKWLSLAGLPALQIAFVRYFIHFLLAILVYLPREGLPALKSNSPLKQFLRSTCLLGATIFNFLALKYLPISVTTTISFAGPMLVTLLAIPLLGEKVGIHRFSAVCVAFVGVLVVVQPWDASFHPAMLLSLSVLLCGSIYYIVTRMLSGIDGNATMQLWSSGMGTVALLPLALSEWTWPVSIHTWVILCFVGFFGAAAHTIVAAAHRLADASILAPIVYIQVFFATVSGILVFGSWPTISTLAGGAIIIASGLYIWQRTSGRKPSGAPLGSISNYRHSS